jgi:hypothetical protein
MAYDIDIAYDGVRLRSRGAETKGTSGMRNTSKSSPFVIATGLLAIRDEHASTGLNQHRTHALRQWRPSPPPFVHPPAAQPRDTDPYLFVLLADQELRDRRPEQAETLIEAAYAAYDQCKFGS